LRGQEIIRHNEKVRETGIGSEFELRPTDLSEEAARHRYRVFKEHTWDALQSLKEHFHYHFVNANGPVHEVEENILQEMQYQSSLELDPRTFDRMRRLPAASDIILRARQDLVRRLDSYEYEHPVVFEQVIELVDKKIMPIVMRHAISGHAIVNSEDPLLDSPLALAMLIDIFSERGFHATVDIQRQETPVSVDLKTGLIHIQPRKVYRIHIHFRGSQIRRG
jgi:adenylate kinase